MNKGMRKREPLVLGSGGDVSASLDVDRQFLNLDGERASLNVAIDRSERRNSRKLNQNRRSGPGHASQRHVKRGRGADSAWRRCSSKFDTPRNGTTQRAFGNLLVLMALNDEILAAGGTHWQDWREFDPRRIDAAAAVDLRARAKSALSGEFGDASLPIVKDPRMCRLLPFWCSVFREAEWSVRPVLPLRSPLEVALSLNRRNGIAPGLGCLIWLRHVLDAEAETREHAPGGAELE